MASEKNVPALVAGLNRSKKLIIAGQATGVYLATDADETIKNMMTALCNEKNVPIEQTKSKAELAELCGIEVGCAVCVLTN